jgi:16S rRNA A1518/A1519 N6-dimethyltransferase RsmA/KsgA/DIM1 with predicted DNA glycosylase/AP lyase activity
MAQNQAKAVVDAAAPEDKRDIVEVDSGPGAEVMARELAALKAQRVEIERREKLLTTALKLMAGEHDGVRHGDLVLYTLSRSAPLRVNSDAIKEQFPFEEYPTLYHAPTEQVMLTIEKGIKSSVFVEAQGAIE